MKIKTLTSAATLALFAILGFHPLSARAQGTAFTYQGSLSDSGSPANGNYDLRFILYSADAGGSQVGPILTNSATGVSGGLFTVTLDFGANVFTNSVRFLEISARTNGGGGFAVLAPRQELTPAPYAVFAGSVASGGLVGSYTNRVGFSNSLDSFVGIFSGNGGGLLDVNAATLDGINTQGLWQTHGNSGTSPGVNFFGTLDDQPLLIKVNSREAARFEPTADTLNVVGGFSGNFVQPGLAGVTIGGGGTALDNQPNVVTSNGFYATIAGGYDNTAGGYGGVVLGGSANAALGDFSGIGGGQFQFAPGANSWIGGGLSNYASGVFATIGGGYSNYASGGSGGAATVGGGFYNNAAGNAATISGGADNTAGGIAATIPGGQFNTAAGNVSFAGGFHAHADQDGSFVWADFNSLDFRATANNQFRVRATGGAAFVTAINNDGSVASGVHLLAGETAWSSISDKNAKKNFQPVDGGAVLEKLAAIPVQQWNYKWEADTSTPHIGPMAQDFVGAFYPGRDDKSISTLEFDGVELAAIQGLNHKMDEQLKAKDARIDALEKELLELREAVRKLSK